MSDDARPDDTLGAMDIQPSGQEPQVYSVVDLRAYLKPPMDEELSSPAGGAADPGSSTICTCVPVEDCVCNTVTYHGGSDPCPNVCSCVGDTCYGGCHGVYYYPY